MVISLRKRHFEGDDMYQIVRRSLRGCIFNVMDVMRVESTIWEIICSSNIMSTDHQNTVSCMIVDRQGSI